MDSSPDDGSANSLVFLTGSHRDPTPGARPAYPHADVAMLLSADTLGSAEPKPCYGESADLLLAFALEEKVWQNGWPTFKASILQELEPVYVAEALLEHIERYNLRRLRSNDFRRTSRTGAWNDLGKVAVQAKFARLLASQITFRTTPTARRMCRRSWPLFSCNHPTRATGQRLPCNWRSVIHSAGSSSGRGTRPIPRLDKLPGPTCCTVPADTPEL